MGGLFGVVSNENCINDLFYGIDYHSHLGTTIGGTVVLSNKISEPIFHDISNSQFKTEFREDFERINGNLGIGVISSKKVDRQPIVIRSKIGTFAICTDGIIKNIETLVSELVEEGVTFKELTNGFNQTELVGELICKGSDITDGIVKMYKKIHGSISLLLLSEEERCIYASSGAFPLVTGKKETLKGQEWSIASETTAFPNLKYEVHSYLKYNDIISISKKGLQIRMKSQEKIIFCPFLHVYFDFPASSHYGINGEIVRERCGGFLAENDDITSDLVMGVADSGIPHAHGYVKKKIELASKKSEEAFIQFKDGAIDSVELEKIIKENLELIPPLRRPVIKYTAAWGRSYIPPKQTRRDLVAYYKQVSNPHIIPNKSLVLVDDSIRRGTQLQRFLKEKIWPYNPKEVHARIASPPQLFSCYFNETSEDSTLIARKAIKKNEGKEPSDLVEYLNMNSLKYEKMVSIINATIGATSLKYISLPDMKKAIIETSENNLLKEENLCTYCWTGTIPISK
jgi:amidophosphoribosyltransferase